ncbi:hypothetical protein ACFQFE_05195 [Methylobacterium gregans]
MLLTLAPDARLNARLDARADPLFPLRPRVLESASQANGTAMAQEERLAAAMRAAQGATRTPTAPCSEIACR